MLSMLYEQRASSSNDNNSSSSGCTAAMANVPRTAACGNTKQQILLAAVVGSTKELLSFLPAGSGSFGVVHVARHIKTGHK